MNLDSSASREEDEKHRLRPQEFLKNFSTSKNNHVALVPVVPRPNPGKKSLACSTSYGPGM